MDRDSKHYLPEIRGRRVCLRTLELSDSESLLETWGDPQVMQFMSRTPLGSLSEAQEFIAGIHRMTAERALFQWGMQELGDGELVGTCTLANLDFANRRTEIGFAVARRLWGQGLLSDVLPALLDHAFDELGLHRIDADVDPTNDASLHLLEKHGFAREGYLRECYQLHGKTQDSVVLGLLHPDWLALKRSQGRQVGSLL